jgi:hypothetical protein
MYIPLGAHDNDVGMFPAFALVVNTGFPEPLNEYISKAPGLFPVKRAINFPAGDHSNAECGLFPVETLPTKIGFPAPLNEYISNFPGLPLQRTAINLPSGDQVMSKGLLEVVTVPTNTGFPAPLKEYTFKVGEPPSSTAIKFAERLGDQDTEMGWTKPVAIVPMEIPEDE